MPGLRHIVEHVVPHFNVDRWLSQLGVGNPLNLFKTHHRRRWAKISHQNHERVCLDVA